MTRIFQEHRTRKIQDLNGLWDFYFPRKGSNISPMELKKADRRILSVPGVWETLIGKENYRGQALASKCFEIDSDSTARLVFKGISHTAVVFLDGKELGTHHNAFTPFSFDIPKIGAGSHRLMVQISNEHGDISALHVPNDYYNYGGINRPAELQILAATSYVRYNHFSPSQTKSGEWRAQFSVQIVNMYGDFSAAVRIRLAGQSLEFKGLRVKKGVSGFAFECIFPRAILPWTPETPKLYELETELVSDDGAILDDLLDRVGFRTIETKGSKILLNRRPVFMFGFNRHEDHPLHGSAQTLDTILQDIDIIVDSGANAVRTSHYPNDERFLDLCDEKGILVWEENHARGLSLEQMKHPRFREQCRNCISEMIESHYNHPSIVLWGILNECSSETPEGRELYKEQFAQIMKLDKTRPTTFASCKHFKDICQDLPDVLGWNMYSNWYGNSPPKEDLQRMADWLDSLLDNPKPLIISEFGGGAIPGYFDPRRKAKWSEERQAEILDECLDAYLNDKRLSGAFIWQFCDIRVDQSWAFSRPRSMNNKGVISEFRRPKLSYDLVKRRFCGFRRKICKT